MRHNSAPKKVLPTSPIKIFAGYQLKKRNASKLKPIGKRFIFVFKDAVIIITVKHPEINPSIPSIKFIKLIKAEAKIIKNKITINLRPKILESGRILFEIV